jgi:hypothetical protein
VQLTLGLLPLPYRYSETITVGEWVNIIEATHSPTLLSHYNDKAGVVIQVSAAHTPIPIKYNRSYPLPHGYCLTMGSFSYILLVGVCVQLTLGLLSLPCRYGETITVGEWVASLYFIGIIEATHSPTVIVSL